MFSVNVVLKVAASGRVFYLANCILLYAYSVFTYSCAKAKLHIAYSTS